MADIDDIKFMRRCFDLATRAEGLTYPNPVVGAVIVHDGRIIGEGYHLKAGEPHAEVNAINSVSDRSKFRESTLYVNLEPCSHFGKTPPCADRIIAEGIPRVVVGATDTSSKVSGKGIMKLRDANIEVVTGILNDECRWINRRFFTFHEKNRPYITLKWAQSADGYLDIIRSDIHAKGPNWITGKPERVLVHKWRAAEQSILVGAETVRADNPRLNVREWKGPDPLKLILSRSGLFTGNPRPEIFSSNTVVFSESPGDIFGKAVVRLRKDVPSSVQIAEYLHSVGIQSLFIEGGAEVLNHFISTGLWDEARVFTGKYGFNDGVRAPEVKGLLFSATDYSESHLEIYLNVST